MTKEQTYIGYTDELGAICINKKGPVELWNNPAGDYTIYLRIDGELFLHNKRYYPEEAELLFKATLRMVRKR
ncbi:hypothetical protein ACFLUQ_01385 [Chloroflexota bacterium]